MFCVSYILLLFFLTFIFFHLHLFSYNLEFYFFMSPILFSFSIFLSLFPSLFCQVKHFVLSLSIENLNSTVEIADINGSSPENVLVDKTLSAVYNSHQVWHYPGMKVEQEMRFATSAFSKLSKINSNIVHIPTFRSATTVL